MRFEFTVICQIYYVGMKKASKLMSKFLALETKKKKKKKRISWPKIGNVGKDQVCRSR